MRGKRVRLNTDQSIGIIVFSYFICNLGNFAFPMLTFIFLKIPQITNENLGVVLMVINLARVPGAYIGGRVSGRVDQIFANIVTSILCGILMFIAIFAQRSLWMILIFSITSFIYGFSVPILYRLLFSYNNGERGIAFTYWAKNLGSTISLLFAGILFAKSPELLLALDGLARIASGAVMIFLKLCGSNCLGAIQKTANPNKEPSESLRLHNPFVIITIALTLVFTFVYSQFSYILPIQLNDLFGATAPKFYSILTMVNCVVVIVLTPLIGLLLKNRLAYKNVVLSFILLGIGMGGYSIRPNIFFSIMFTMIWSLGEVLYEIYQPIMLSKMVKYELIGVTMGLNESLHSITGCLATFFSGLILTFTTPETSWIIFGILILVAALTLSIENRISKNAKRF